MCIVKMGFHFIYCYLLQSFCEFVLMMFHELFAKSFNFALNQSLKKFEAKSLGYANLCKLHSLQTSKKKTAHNYAKL